MKLIMIPMLSILLSALPVFALRGQSAELVQLSLNIEKLAQFRAILKQMKQGYAILNGGYQTVKDLSEGNFTLHKTFFDQLLQVSPLVKKYHKVAKIIQMQVRILEVMRSTQKQMGMHRFLNAAEQKYVLYVHKNLLESSYANMDELLLILRDQVLSMGDAERMHAIDGIYEAMEEKLLFLNSFLVEANLLYHQRKKELIDSKSIGIQYGITP